MTLVASRSAKLLVVIALTSLVGCVPATTTTVLDGFMRSYGESVTVVAGDRSPPVVTLTIPDLGLGHGEIVLREGDAPVDIDVTSIASQSNGFYIVAAAEDPQGVQSVCIFTGGSEVCTTDGITQEAIYLTVPICDAIQVNPGQTALTRRWIPKYYDFREHAACGSGSEGEERFGYRVEGTNTAGQKVSTPAVTFINRASQ